jgi:NAD kinase
MKILFMDAHTEKAKELYSIIERKYPMFLTEENPELILVAGGDGSMIRAIHKEISKNVPFFGIGKGTLNFLMNEIDDIEELINSNFKSVDFGIEETKCVEVTIIKKNGQIFNYQSVNEVVLGGTVMGYHTFSFSTEDMAFNNHILKSEKFVVSTPLGSTAYHYNNEGVIIPDLSYPIYGVTTGVGPKDEKLNIFVKEQKIELEITFTRDICYLFVDGINTIDFEVGDKVILTPGQTIRLAFLDKKGFQIKRLNRSNC